MKKEKFKIDAVVEKIDELDFESCVDCSQSVYNNVFRHWVKINEIIKTVNLIIKTHNNKIQRFQNCN